MELTEPIETINKRLKDVFGIDTLSGMPIWRVVWTDDQFEYQLCEYSEAGLVLLTPETRLVPKYRQWNPHKYLLERLVIVPSHQAHEIGDKQISYEPIFTYMDGNDNALPPKWEITELVIQTIYAVQYGNNKGIARYVDPEKDPEAQRKRVDALMEQLYGDESSLMLTTKTGETVAGFYDKMENKK